MHARTDASSTRTRACVCKGNLFRSHVLNGEKGGGGGGRAEAADEWMNLKTVVSGAFTKPRARLWGTRFFRRTPPRPFFFTLRGFSTSPLQSSSPSLLLLHRARLAIALNDRFVIRGYAERGFACLVSPLRFPPLAVFAFSLVSPPLLSIPLWIPGPSDSPWRWFRDPLPDIPIVLRRDRLPASERSNCIGYRKLWAVSGMLKRSSKKGEIGGSFSARR